MECPNLRGLVGKTPKNSSSINIILNHKMLWKLSKHSSQSKYKIAFDVHIHMSQPTPNRQDMNMHTYEKERCVF